MAAGSASCLGSLGGKLSRALNCEMPSAYASRMAFSSLAGFECIIHLLRYALEPHARATMSLSMNPGPKSRPSVLSPCAANTSSLRGAIARELISLDAHGVGDAGRVNMHDTVLVAEDVDRAAQVVDVHAGHWTGPGCCPKGPGATGGLSPDVHAVWANPAKGKSGSANEISRHRIGAPYTLFMRISAPCHGAMRHQLGIRDYLIAVTSKNPPTSSWPHRPRPRCVRR